MNAPRKRLELETLESRETPSAGSLAVSGFDPTSLQGMVSQLSAQVGAILNSELQTLAAFQQAAVSGMLSSLPAMWLLHGAPGSSMGTNPHS